MHINDIMRDFSPAYPESHVWEDTFKVLREDPVDFNVVTQLLEELDNYGEFRDPVILSSYDDWQKAENRHEYEEGEERDVYFARVEDGTHRVFAHFLHATQKDVKVQVGYQSNEEELAAYIPSLVSIVSFPSDSQLDDRSDDTWDIFERLRSFKLSEELWVTADTMMSSKGKFYLAWAFGKDEIMRLFDAVPLLDSKVEEILIGLGVSPKVTTTVLSCDSDEDALYG